MKKYLILIPALVLIAHASVAQTRVTSPTPSQPVTRSTPVANTASQPVAPSAARTAGTPAVAKANPVQPVAAATPVKLAPSLDRVPPVPTLNTNTNPSKSLPQIAPKPKPVTRVVPRPSPSSAEPEQAVDLSAAPTAPTPPDAKAAPAKTATGAPAGRPSMQSPINLKVFFDLDLYSRPGVNNLTFDNFHSFLFLEAAPLPGFQFSFDVNPTPKFYELDYQATPTIQIRGGRIWIPFDDTAFHNIYGGRVNVSKLSSGAAFLPDNWTDMGVGVKWTIADRRNINIVGDLYVVNGFKAGTGDPLGTANSPYPIFSDSSLASADNNTDKAIGGRVHGLFWNRLGLGFSAFTERWSADNTPSYRILILGGDFQYRFPATLTEVRLGLANMKITAPTGTYYRGGSYLELGQFLTKNRMWKGLLRGGTLQTDDRVEEATDRRLVGLTLIWRPNPILEISLEHSSDLEKVGTKTNYSFTNLRTVVAF